MLIQFAVENFFSFKEEAILSFLGNKTTKEHEEENIFYLEGHKILKSLAIYGANASGKTNLFLALSFMLDCMQHGLEVIFREDAGKSTAFLLSPTTAQESSFFELVFAAEGQFYHYGFEIFEGKLQAEWLYRGWNKEEELFQREKQQINYDKDLFSEGDRLAEKTRSDVLFLLVCAQFNGTIAKSILDYVAKVNVLTGLKGESILGLGLKKFEEDERFRLWLQQFMQPLGIERISLIEESGKREYCFWHQVFDESGQGIESQGLPLARMSTGTRKLLYFLAPIYEALEGQEVLFIDELDASFHPLLLALLLKLFHRHNKKGAQFAFSLHNPRLLEQKLLRRDQIYFVEKTPRGASQLYSLLDYKVRNDEKLDKNYLKGKYGALPELQLLEEKLLEYGQEE